MKTGSESGTAVKRMAFVTMIPDNRSPGDCALVTGRNTGIDRRTICQVG